jgi:hypothetical protein
MYVRKSASRNATITFLALTIVATHIAASEDRAEAPADTSTLNEPEVQTRSDFDRLKSLAGEWIDTTGTSTGVGKVAAVYRVTSGGSVVQETVFPGSSHEMVTMYTAAGDDIVMSHYCAMGNQPRMRARSGPGDELIFAFDGGGVADPAKDMHMHNGLIRFDGNDRLYAEWQIWQDGAPGTHKAQFTMQRKPPADGS